MIKVFCDRCGNLFETISSNDFDGEMRKAFIKFEKESPLLCPECEKEVYEFIFNSNSKKKENSEKNDNSPQKQHITIKAKGFDNDWSNQAGKALKEISSLLSYKDEDKNKEEDNESEKKKDNHFYKYDCMTPVLTFGTDNASWDFPAPELSQPPKESPSLEELLKELNKTVFKAIADMPADAGYAEILDAAMDEVKKTGLDKEISEAFERQLNKINNDKNKKNGVF